MINRVHLEGRLTDDMNTKTIINVTLKEFTLAVSTGTTTSFFDCAFWGPEALAFSAARGDLISIEGSLKQERWQNEGGENRSRVSVRVYDAVVLKEAQERSPSKEALKPKDEARKGLSDLKVLIEGHHKRLGEEECAFTPKLKLGDVVRLKSDLPESSLKKDDIGKVVSASYGTVSLALGGGKRVTVVEDDLQDVEICSTTPTHKPSH